MATIVTRASKGSALTWTEGDANITNLNNDKIENVVEDLTPQLGGTLDANGNTIDMGVNEITDTKVGNWDTAYSWGNHASAGYSTATSLDGLSDVAITAASVGEVLQYNGTNWVDVNPSVLSVGTAGVGSTVTLTADNTTNATRYPLFSATTVGDVSPRTDTGFTYNPSTGVLTATSFAGSLNGSVGATTASTGAFTTLSASSTVSGTGFSTYLASPPAIGGTAPSTGAFTTLSATGATNSPKLSLTTAALSSTAWGALGVGIRASAATYTDTTSSGTVAQAHVHTISTPTIASSSVATFTDAATVYIANQPTAGTNTTITNAWALLTNGKIKSGGDLVLGAGLNAGGSLGSSGQVLQSTGTGVQWATAGGSAPPFAIVSGTILNQEFTGFVNAAIAETTLPHTWSELYDPSNLVTVSTDTVTISAAGTYLIEYKSNYIPWWSMSANAASGGRALPEATFKLYNSTDATTLGSSIIGAGSNYITSGFTYTFYEKQIMFTSVITIAASKSLTIRYAISQPSAGVYNNTGTKLVYTSNPSTPKMKITKLA